MNENFYCQNKEDGRSLHVTVSRESKHIVFNILSECGKSGHVVIIDFNDARIFAEELNKVLNKKEN